MEAFPLGEDIELVQELLGLSSRALSANLGISRVTLNHWAKEPRRATREKLEVFYSYAYDQGIRLSEIHAQLFQEETRERGLVPLFHGSKQGISGPLSLGESRADNDFGCGFYCGESFSQASMFVARYPQSVCYFAAFDERGLNAETFAVNEEWMLAVALFRGKLQGYEDNAAVKAVFEAVDSADYVVAPIADNRMFQIIDSFIDGEITDEQCKHGLSATALGSQFVLKSEASLRNVVKLQPHYLCASEKAARLVAQRERRELGNDKVKAAKRQYRSQGRYIEELLS